ncbi:MAG TPA: glycosyltransferase family 2 protein, partial [Proteobacteria bacterium]|nr:glycosyltransferase family 2 protein [Pseudomonadota bacterium]
MVDVSIVVVNYNTREHLYQCLHSIFGLSHGCSYEVFVVDNGSTDGSAAMVRSNFPRAKLIASPENLGFVKANNIALRMADGRYFLLLNADARLLPGALDAMVEFMNTHPDAGACGCKQVDPSGNIQLTWGYFPTLAREVVRKAMHARLSLNGNIVRAYLAHRFNGQTVVDWVAGSCLMVRSSIREQVGLMDEGYFMYFEDIDWCHRIQQAGWKVYYLPHIQVVHEGGASANKHKIDAILAYRRSQFYFTRKYYGPAVEKMLRFIISGKSLLNLARWGLKYVFMSNGSAERELALCHT